MPGKKQNALATIARISKVLEAVIHVDVRGILFGIAREESELRQLPSQAEKKPAQNPQFFFAAFFGEGQIKVAQSDFAQTAMRRVHQQTNSLAKSARQGPGQHADQARHQPDRRVFKLVPERGQIGTVPSRGKYFK